jgi:hypothetical protein
VTLVRGVLRLAPLALLRERQGAPGERSIRALHRDRKTKARSA